MNEKARELGMSNTHFINCCGLDVDGHTSSARDVAVMSRELINNHPQIKRIQQYMDGKHNTHYKKRREGFRAYQY